MNKEMLMCGEGNGFNVKVFFLCNYFPAPWVGSHTDEQGEARRGDDWQFNLHLQTPGQSDSFNIKTNTTEAT